MATEAKQFNPRLVFDLNAVIPISQTDSQAIDLHGTVLVGVRFPAAITGTDITFLGSSSLTETFTPLVNDLGVPLQITAAASTYSILDPFDLSGVRFIKLRSSLAEVAQRTLNLVCRGSL